MKYLSLILLTIASLAFAVGPTVIDSDGARQLTDASESVSGLVKAGKLPGITDGNAISSGYVGEEKEIIRPFSSKTNIDNNTDMNVVDDTLDLTPGKWMISGAVGFSGNSNTVTQFIIGVSTTSATLPNSSLTLTPDSNGQIRINSYVSAGGLSMSGFTGVIPVYTVNISSSVSLYLVINMNGVSNGVHDVHGFLKAIRI